MSAMLPITAGEWLAGVLLTAANPDGAALQPDLP